MTTTTTIPVDAIRNQIRSEWTEMVAEIRCRYPHAKYSTLAEYRLRRAVELARWNRWSDEICWAIAD